jgi:hypothetical protein
MITSAVGGKMSEGLVQVKERRRVEVPEGLIN